MNLIKVIMGSLVFGGMLSLHAFAQSYPSKPIRIVFPFSAGTGGDAMSRIIAQKLSEALKQPVVVDPRPGANGIVGTDIAAKSPPDGHTIIFTTTNTQTINPNLYSKLPYDPIKDFIPITKIGSTPYFLVLGNHVSANSLKEFVSLAKANPGKYSLGYTTSTPQMTGELFRIIAGINLLFVPYKTSTAAYTDLNTGQLDAMLETVISSRPQIKAGRMKAIAVTSARRSVLMPEIPTIAESGYPGFESDTLVAAFAPTGTPKEIIATLHDQIVRIVQIPEIKEQIQQIGIEVITSTPQELGDMINRDVVKWARVIKEANIPKAN